MTTRAFIIGQLIVATATLWGLYSLLRAAGISQ